MITERCFSSSSWAPSCLPPSAPSFASPSSNEHVWMSTPQRIERAVITVITVQDTDGGAETGHVILGVLGGIAFTIFFVAFVVPIVRWRKRRTASDAGSRASSRRTHARIISEYHQDAVAPLLEEQPRGMAVNGGALMATQGPQTTPSRPPTAMLNWKILQTLPNFDDESDESSFGKPIDPKDRKYSQEETGLRLVEGDRRSAALPPIPSSAEQSRSSTLSTLVGPTTPTSPLVNAFQRSISLTASDSVSNSNTGSTFRYPSLASSSSKSTVPSLDTSANPQTTTKSVAFTHSPSWLPKTLVPGSERSAQPSETWWRVPSMPPIPESVHSASISSSHHLPETKQGSSPPAAHLRDSNASAGPSTIRHVRELSGETSTHGSLSRSSTQHTEHSNKASLGEGDERRVSILTHATFGRQGHADSRDASDARPSTSEEGGLVTPVSPTKPEASNLRRVKRRTFDFPREPSPPLVPTPLSAPPPLQSPRPGYTSHSTPPSSQPVPDPQSPEDAEPDAEHGGPYGHNEEASSSSEQLLPPSDAVPFPPELPNLPDLSPITFEFKLDSAPASRSNTISTRSGSKRSDNSKGRARGHLKSPSKASTMSALSSATGSKHSLRSLSSFSSGRPGSQESRSKSHERTKHNRRVTFGDQPNSPVPVVDTPTDIPSSSSDVKPVPMVEPQRKVSRPLPTLPVMAVSDCNVPLPGQVGTSSLQGRG